MDTPKKPKVVVACTTVTTPRSVITTTSSTTTTTTTSTSNTITSASTETSVYEPEKDKLTESQLNIHRFWPNALQEVEEIDSIEPGNQALPLARIKKIMKLDEDVKMISCDAPVLFSKAIELFIQELTLRAWLQTEQNKRRTLQRCDIAMAITKYDQFDFLIDIVPREEIKVYKKNYDGKWSEGGGEGGTLTTITATAITDNGAGNSSSTNGSEDMQYFFQLAQQHQKITAKTSTGTVTNGGSTVFDLATVIGAAGGHQPLAQSATAPTTTPAATTQQEKNVSSGGETQAAAGSGSASTPRTTTSRQPQQQNPSSQATVRTTTGQSIILANGGTATSASSVANGNTTTANQAVSANQSLQLLQHVMSPTGEITQIPLNFIRTAGTGGATNAGQPIFIQTAPMQAGPTIIHTTPTGVLLSANQLQQLQQQQPSKQPKSQPQTPQQQTPQQQPQQNHHPTQSQQQS